MAVDIMGNVDGYTRVLADGRLDGDLPLKFELAAEAGEEDAGVVTDKEILSFAKKVSTGGTSLS